MTIPTGHTRQEIQSIKAILDPMGNLAGTYTQGGSESLLATWIRDSQLGGMVLAGDNVDARNYGVFGDNQDHTMQLQKAIDTLDAFYANDSWMQTLVLPDGPIRISSTINLKRVGLRSRSGIPNAGCRVLWDGASGTTALQADDTKFNPSFGLIQGVNFRAGAEAPGIWIDLTTYLGPSPAIDVMYRLRECHFNGSLSHAINMGDWINCHWEHLRFDAIGNGYAIHATPGAALSTSSFVLDGFTYDHSRSTDKGFGFFCVNNTEGASNTGPVVIKNGRIEVNSTWAARAAVGTLGSTRSVLTERLSNTTPVARSVGWNISDVSYSDASGMTDDSLVFRDTSGAVSDASPRLSFSNVQVVNLQSVFAGGVGPRMLAIPTSALQGLGTVNPASGSAAALSFGFSSSIFQPTLSPNASITALRGSLALANGNIMSATGFIKESDSTNVGWSRILTSYTQTLAYAASITPAHNLGNYITVGSLTGNLTVNSMTASGTYFAGLTVKFAFSSDATGGRTVSWNASWKGATLTTASGASQKAIVTFEYDGASWVQVASTGWYS